MIKIHRETVCNKILIKELLEIYKTLNNLIVLIIFVYYNMAQTSSR